jgi:hypothetical protein
VVTFGRPRLDGSVVKVVKLAPAAADDPFSLFKKLYSAYDSVFILESLVGPK